MPAGSKIYLPNTYFIRQVVPVAEELGMRIGIHPDDPPVPELGGVPRCIFGNFDGYARALEIANSPNIGICLCAGTWREGGQQMVEGVFEAARAFAKRTSSGRFISAMSAGGSLTLWKPLRITGTRTCTN